MVDAFTLLAAPAIMGRPQPIRNATARTARSTATRNAQLALGVEHAMRPFEFEFFSSSFCSPCTHTRAVLEQAVALLPSATLREHNIADIPERAETLGIRSTPTVIVRDGDGAEVMRAEGVPTINHLLVAAEKAMGLG